MSIHFKIDIDEVVQELDRLIQGPDLAEFESAMLQGYLATADRVHVITGFLKGSGNTSSQTGTGSWKGTIGFARYPGIYELALGDVPTKNHPEGGHFFFDPGGELFTDLTKEALIAWLTGGEGLASEEDYG